MTAKQALQDIRALGDAEIAVHLMPQGRKPLYRLIKSQNLWERRIALIATYHFIRHNEFEDTLALCEWVLNDREDLIHKASGWMLREIAKRDEARAEEFLQRHHCCPVNYENMDSVFVTATVASMDAGAELIGTYLQRVAVANAGFMSPLELIFISPWKP